MSEEKIKTKKDLEEKLLKKGLTIIKSNVDEKNSYNNYDNQEFPTVNAKEIIDEKVDPREVILSPWLPQAGLVMVYAARGVGKTFFCLNCVYSIASGGEFLNFKAPQERKVLYIDGEMKYIDLQSRLISIAKTQGDLHDWNNIRFITPDKCPDYKVPKIDTPIGQNIINNIINKYNIDVVVFDNLSTLTSMDENKADAWNNVQDWQIKLRAQGRSVIMVHHSGKSKDVQRGTSKREDILDSVILLQEIENNEANTRFKVQFTKHRGFFGKDTFPFEAFLKKDGTWGTKNLEQTTMEKVLELHNLGNMNYTEIARELNIHKSNVTRSMKRAIEQGLII